jgi:hypothetical protein
MIKYYTKSFINSFTAWFDTSKTKLGNIPKIKAKIAKGKSISFSLVFKSDNTDSSYLDQNFPKTFSVMSKEISSSQN